MKRNICQVCTSDALTTCLQNRENLNIFAANTHKKFASATQRKALNNSTSSAWPYLASPEVEGSSLLDFSCCLGFFSSGSCQECQAQAAFVWSKQCPFTSTLKNPETKALLQPNPTRFAPLEGRQKSSPVPFAVPCLHGGDGAILPGTKPRPRSRPGAGRALLVTQSLPSVPCNSGKLHFRAPFSPLSSEKISADLTEALTCNASTGQGPFRGGEAGFQLRSSCEEARGNIFQYNRAWDKL